MRSVLFILLFMALGAAVASPALAADEPGAPEGADLSRAEALFAAGKAAMARKDYDQACRAFEDSLKLDESLGTRINLALCNEERGRVATAWGQFKDVEGRAAKAGPTQANRARVAAEHALALAPRISRVVIEVTPAASVKGITVTIDGRPASDLLWQTGIPVDVGTHTIVASAPGKLPTQVRVRVDDESQVVTAKIEAFTDAPVEVKERPPTGIATADVILATDRVSTRRTQRTLGWVVGGTGVAVTAAGFVLGALTLANVPEANTCTTAKPCPLTSSKVIPGESERIDAARSARGRAEGFGLAATVTIPVGLVLIAAGAYLLYRGLQQSDGPAARAAGLRFFPGGAEF